jgi:hypothetical protein
VRHRAKVFSCLRSLSEEIYQQGLARLEADLVRGPVSFTSKYMLLWAKNDSGKDLVKTHQTKESSLVTKLELPRDSSLAAILEHLLRNHPDRP